MKAVKIKEIVDNIDMQTDEAEFYLNKKTGEIIYAVDEDGNSKAENYEDDDNYIPLPDKFDIHEYKIMEDFCLSIEDEKLKDTFIITIRGSGAFRRFKDMAYRHEILEKWYEYKENALKQIAIDWCKENNVNYTE